MATACACSASTRLDPLDRVSEGDPGLVGNRISGMAGHSGGKAARAEPVDQVVRFSLTEGLPAVAEELAVRVLQALRARPHGAARGRSVLALRVLKPFYARVGRDLPKYTG